MKIYEKIANNKIAVLITGAHWIVISAPLISFYGDMIEKGVLRQATWSVFTLAVLIFDLPAISVALLICLPLCLFRENENIYWYGVFLTSLFTITFQWLFLVKLAHNSFSKDERELTALSLNDE